MKKYLISIVVAAAAFLGVYYLVYFEGLFLPTDLEPKVPFRTEGMNYQYQTENGSYETIIFQGVDLSASMPGYEATQYKPTEEEYLRWLTAIGEMGANLVRTTTLMDDDFYNALYTYNTTGNEPIYLLPGTSVSDYANAGAEDGYAVDFYTALIEDGRALVDIIHGRKNLLLNTGEGFGFYRKDVSPWVVGWLVGTDWNTGTVAYTDHREMHDTSYTGTYFTTTEESTRFETMLAKVMDEVTRYETQKYGEQRPIGFVNSPTSDFLEYEECYGRQLEKYVYIDSEHLLTTDAMKAGQFAAYSLFDFCDDFQMCLSERQRSLLSDILETLSEDALYGGYMELMGHHHTMPILVAGYGFSSGRNPIRKDRAPLTETEQGEQLLMVYNEALRTGWSGVCISTWQDTWERITWNNAFSVDLTSNNMWHDLQSDSQNYGLMAFIPKEPVCMVDGDISEWKEEDVVLTKDGVRLSARYDTEGVYVMLSGEKLNEKDLYIPIDITPVTGTTSSKEPAFEFSRGVDFLLRINGRNNTRLMVQDRYDARVMNFGYECDQIDPFVHEPEADTQEFSPVTLAVKNPYLLTAYEWYQGAASEKKELTALGVYNTGYLKHGSWDKNSRNYSTLADFCYGDDCVELRLPWGLLNVGDPSDRQIHDDYYEHYGVELLECDGIWFGIATDENSQAGEMARFQWKGWSKVEFQERLKDSYYVIQQAWR